MAPRLIVLGMLTLAAMGASAQETTDNSARPASAPAEAVPTQRVLMEEPLPGDHWTLEVRDEISGTVSAVRTHTITEVTPTTIGVRVDTLGKSDPGQIIFDRDWNITISGTWKYSPHDGSGIRRPLSEGKSWPVETEDLNSENGKTWKRSGRSRVAGQETITTKAGTFETFKIETNYARKNAKNPTQKNEIVMVTWHAPAVNHWVRRTFVSRSNRHLLINNVVELVAYGRRKGT